MAINDLRRRLFRKNEDFARRYKIPPLEKHRLGTPRSWTPPAKESEVPKSVSLEKRAARGIVWWGIGGGLFVILAGVGFFLFSSRNPFRAGYDTLNNVALRIDGGTSAASGSRVVWKVIYKNSNSVPLEGAALIFEFPPRSQSSVGGFSKDGLRPERRELGTLAPGATGEEEFSALVFGGQEEMLLGKVSLEYRPENYSARFSKLASYTTAITGSLLGAKLELPNNLQAGQEVEIKLHISSNAESTFQNMSAGIDYPEAFEYVSASPVPQTGNNLWSLGDVAPGADLVISIHGKVKKSESPETFHAQVGLFNQTDSSWMQFAEDTASFSVASSLLSVSLEGVQGEKAYGVASPGTTLGMAVLWKNNLPVPVENVTVAVSFEGDIFDLRTLQSDSGEFSDGALRWAPGRVRELNIVNPGDSGRFSFLVHLRDVTPQSQNDKNFTAKVKAAITSTKTPPGYEGVQIAGSAERDYKIATQTSFTQKGYYYDTRIANTGPLPPRVGQETTYTIVWSVVNSLNDLKNITIEATLPSYVTWKGVTSPDSAGITHDQSTGTVSWSPTAVPSGSGFEEPAEEVAFQISFTPSLPQVRKTPQLISEASFTAQDSFSGINIHLIGRRITTGLTDDSRASQQGGVVQE